MPCTHWRVSVRCWAASSTKGWHIERVSRGGNEQIVWGRGGGGHIQSPAVEVHSTSFRSKVGGGTSVFKTRRRGVRGERWQLPPNVSNARRTHAYALRIERLDTEGYCKVHLRQEPLVARHTVPIPQRRRKKRKHEEKPTHMNSREPRTRFLRGELMTHHTVIFQVHTGVAEMVWYPSALQNGGCSPPCYSIQCCTWPQLPK